MVKKQTRTFKRTKAAGKRESSLSLRETPNQRLVILASIFIILTTLLILL